MNENAKITMNENTKTKMNENAKRTMDENANRTMNENANTQQMNTQIPNEQMAFSGQLGPGPCAQGPKDREMNKEQ